MIKCKLHFKVTISIIQFKIALNHHSLSKYQNSDTNHLMTNSDKRTDSDAHFLQL